MARRGTAVVVDAGGAELEAGYVSLPVLRQTPGFDVGARADRAGGRPVEAAPRAHGVRAQGARRRGRCRRGTSGCAAERGPRPSLGERLRGRVVDERACSPALNVRISHPGGTNLSGAARRAYGEASDGGTGEIFNGGDPAAGHEITGRLGPRRHGYDPILAGGGYSAPPGSSCEHARGARAPTPLEAAFQAPGGARWPGRGEAICKRQSAAAGTAARRGEAAGRCATQRAAPALEAPAVASGTQVPRTRRAPPRVPRSARKPSASALPRGSGRSAVARSQDKSSARHHLQKPQSAS